MNYGHESYTAALGWSAKGKVFRLIRGGVAPATAKGDNSKAPFYLVVFKQYDGIFSTPSPLRALGGNGWKKKAPRKGQRLKAF